MTAHKVRLQSVLGLALTVCAGGQLTVAAAQGWPALERADVAEVGGGEHDAAVLIGIDDYPFLPPVVGAEANVQAWERWLTQGRKVPYQRVKVLRGKEVGRPEVRAAVQAAATQVGRRGTLFVVFVGHGAPAQTRRGMKPHLLMGDTKRNQESFAATGIGVDTDLATWTRPASAKGAKVVAVLDACFTGKAQGGGDLIEGAQFAVLSSVAAPARMTVLTAASSTDITGPLPGASRPAFSYLVLAALRGWGDDDGDGEITAHEAVAFAAGVMQNALRPERPALSGTDVSLGLSGGEAVPPYRRWLGLATPPSSRRGTAETSLLPESEAEASSLAAAPESGASKSNGNAGKVTLAASLGTGGGQVTEKSQPETLRDKRITPGFALTPVHTLIEADYWLGEHIAIGGFARLQIVEYALLAGARVKYNAIDVGEHGLTIRAGAGVGHVRHLVDLGVGLDTTQEGPYMVGTGASYTYQIFDGFHALLTPDLMYLFGDSPSWHVDLSAGVQFSF